MNKETIIDALDLPMSKEQFINIIEGHVHNEGMGYAEAIIHLCEEKEYDPEDIAKLITGPLKDKLHQEAIKNNLMKSDSNTATLL